MRPATSYAKLFTSATTLALAAALAGCQSATMRDITGSLSSKASAEPSDGVAALGEKYRSNPRNPELALRYGEALRSNGQHAQAVAVLEQATIANPSNRRLLGAYGRALADTGKPQLAFDVLTRAHTPDNPDWRILSVQGTTLDQLGRHEDARRYYASALKMKPEEPSVLSNLGLSYMLTRELPKAETTLRKAYANAGNDARIRQNLGLVVGLQGRFSEAEAIVRSDLPPDEAASNVAYLREMLSSKDGPQLGAKGQGAPTRG